MARRPSLRAPEQIGAVLLRAPDTRSPVPVDAPPVSAQDWELAVGTKIARRARPTRLERGVLHVRTATSTWAQELSLLADTICAQLRARGMNVRSLRFQVGPVEPLARPAWRTDVRVAPEPAALPPDVRTSLAAVPDADLRDAIARAAATMLGQAAVRERAARGPAPAPVPAPRSGRAPARPMPARPAPARPAPARPARATGPRADTPDERASTAPNERASTAPNERPTGAPQGSGGAATSPRSGARGPRSAAPRSAPPGPATAARRAAPRGTRGGPSAPGS